MTSFHLMRKNLGRKKVRTLFTTLSILVAFLLFGLLGALNQAFSIGVDLAGADRLITVHKVSLIQLLPISYQRRIEAVDDVDEVASFTWFGGYFQEPRQQFLVAPTDPEKLLRIYGEWELPEEQKERWLNNRTGAIIGGALAELYGWEVGDRVPIQTTIWNRKDGSRTWEFTIDGIFSDGGNGANESALYFHYDYFDEARQFGQGLAGWYVIKLADPEQAEAVANTVDAMFANSPSETKTTTEQGWVSGFAKQFGNIGLIVTAVIGAVFFTMLLVAGNTMAQAVRERVNELAVLKTLGFSDRRVLLMVLGESVLLALVGGLIGLGLSVVLAAGMAQALATFLPGFGVSPGHLALGVVLVFALGLVAGALPALQAKRLDVVTALARR